MNNECIAFCIRFKAEEEEKKNQRMKQMFVCKTENNI